MSTHDILWTQPPALLASPAAQVIPAPRHSLTSPVILRFTSDSFMEDFMNVIDASPERLVDFRVRKETWRGFTPDAPAEKSVIPSMVRQRLGIFKKPGVPERPARRGTSSIASGSFLKLYQPAHQRHYLVACSLVCKLAGLPDRSIDAGRGEQVKYVLRRLLPPAGEPDAALDAWEEHAWIPGPPGLPSTWRKIGVNPAQVLTEEERLPLFAVNFAENERRKRRLFAGVIPVGKREIYLGAPKGGSDSPPGVTSRTSRKILLRKEVIEPWKSLVRRARDVNRILAGPLFPDEESPSQNERTRRLKTEREQIQTVSWLVLLDFSKYLATYMKPVWRAVLNPSRREQLRAPEQQLFDVLNVLSLTTTLRERLASPTEIQNVAENQRIYPLENVLVTLREALAKFGAGEEGLDTELEDVLENVVRPYDRKDAERRALWPNFLFPLADPDLPPHAPLPTISLGPLSAEESGGLEGDEIPDVVGDPLEQLDRLAVLIVRALRDDDATPAPEPAIPIAAIAPANPLEGWFVIRCIFERPGCEPLHSEVVSDPTERFQMAGFFDPDAPARPIRIGLPIDTTPAGLRKFDKNTAMVISDTLCGQIGRLKGLTLGDLVLSVLPWPFHKDLPGLGSEPGACTAADGGSLGMICSLSIPIVTICALILLIIMVSILDIFFKWLPFFFICFPLPGLKAKK